MNRESKQKKKRSGSDRRKEKAIERTDKMKDDIDESEMVDTMR